MPSLRLSEHTADRDRDPHLCSAAYSRLRRLSLLPLWLSLSACAQLELTLPAWPDASADPEIAEAGFPTLETPPARPQLGYDLNQARDIQDGLVSDRANARYVGDAIRYETGQLAEPPAALPNLRPLPETSGPGELIADDPVDVARTETALEERLALQEAEIETDDSSLDDFLDDLGVGGQTTALDDGEALPIVRPAAPEPDAAQVAAVEPEPSPAAALGPLGISFAPALATLSDEQIANLRAYAQQLRAQDRGARIVAGGDNVLAIDRGRAIAVRLVASGVPGNLIEIETGGLADQVVLYPSGNR